MPDYKPIDCSLHDELESAATLRRTVSIVYETSEESLEVKDRIVDVFSKDGEEFIRLASGLTIRLDRIISFEGIPFR